MRTVRLIALAIFAVVTPSAIAETVLLHCGTLIAVLVGLGTFCFRKYDLDRARHAGRFRG